jgi:hypothetical protein
MLESSLYLHTIFASILFSIRFSDSKHIVHSTSTEEATLLFVSFLDLFSCLLARTYISISSFVYLPHEGQKQETDQNIDSISSNGLFIGAGVFNWDVFMWLFTHFFLDHIKLGQE